MYKFLIVWFNCNNYLNLVLNDLNFYVFRLNFKGMDSEYLCLVFLGFIIFDGSLLGNNFLLISFFIFGSLGVWNFCIFWIKGIFKYFLYILIIWICLIRELKFWVY